jgi:hypothetical protein
MLKHLPTLLVGLAALATLAGCEEQATVRVREPRAQLVVAQPPVQEVVVTQPRVQQVVVTQPRVVQEVVVAQPRIQQVVVAQPAVEEVVVEGPPVEHIRRAPAVVYEGHPVYWHRNRWYYQNGGRWTYYQAEPVQLRTQRYVVVP